MLENPDESLMLAVGTKVCAKYKGAFCEAKIISISKNLQNKVQNNTNRKSKPRIGNSVKRQIKVGKNVAIKSNEINDIVQGTVLKVQDCSLYTVVFDDGEIACLKRKALHLKSVRYSDTSSTLDKLPLNNPEHSGITSVVKGLRSQKHQKDFGENREEKAVTIEEKDIGKVVCVLTNIKGKIKDNWFPGLIVAPTSQTSIRTNFLVNHLVRSFKDGKYYTVPKKEIIEYTKEIGAKVENRTLITAVNKANTYFDNDELPLHWNRDFLFGVDSIYTDTYDGDNSIKESIEEKDYFVAQLFKFMDDRGTPLNQTPVINEKDIDLYKLFKVVNNCGGYNKVDKDNQWMFVSTEAGHEQQSYLTIKNFYQKYLYGFENFYRKLGCTMLSPPRKGKTRSSFSRSILRNIDKILPSTSSDKNKYVKNKTNNKKNRVSTSAKNVVKAIKVEEKLRKSNEDISKNISNSTSLNKQSVNLDIRKIKDSVKNFKIKIEIDTLNDDQIIEEVKKEKIAKVNPTNTRLLGMKTNTTDEEQTKSFINIITVFKMSNRGFSYYQQNISSTGKFDETTEKKKNVKKKKYNKRKTSSNNTTVVNVKVETFNKNSSVNIGDNLFLQYKQNQLYESKVLEIHDFDGVIKYYIHYIGWNSRYDEWIDKNKIRFKIIEILHGPGDLINEDLSKISTSENNEKIMTVKMKKENENKTKNHISPFVNIKYEPASDEDSSEIVENNVKICYGNNQDIKYDSKHPEKIKTIWKKKYDEMKISNTPSPINIIKDEPSDEESSVTVEDNLIINYGNNQALDEFNDDDYEYDDDDESRLVIVEEPDYQGDENIQTQSLLPLTSSIHPNELEFQSSYQIKINNTSLIDTVNESSICYDKSIQNALISSFEMSSYSKNYDNEVEKVNKCMALPELQFREKMVEEDTLNNTLVIKNNHYVAGYDIHKPSTSKGLFDLIYQPGSNKDSFRATNTSNDTKNSFFVTKQVVNNNSFDTNIPCESNLFDNNTPSTSKYSFYENCMPSTSKQFYNPEADVNSILLHKKAIPDSSNSMAHEQYYQEDTLKMIRKFDDNEVGAFLGLYTMSQSSDKPMVFMANTTEQNIEEDTYLCLNENQKKLNTHGLNEPSTLGIIKITEKSLSKRSISNSPKQSSKRIKLSTTTVPNVPISTVNQDVILMPKVNDKNY
ncbi:hypothetical protein AGLY_008803 [Aphis glycines]|uniref:ARID domain-containing protein n=1 Tax=Aphis glycines TaxID=307491 RepID=A0A6G0TLV2_APHGL|nr:hypothetical protein AGLY_008803 [Aphis glycines]